MPKKIKTSEEHLQNVEYLLAAILLKKEVNIKQVAKVIGCSDNTLTALFPDKKHVKKLLNKGVSDNENQN